jgi:multidrug efflux pump subunit AcrA (membrane-fusion protein)
MVPPEAITNADGYKGYVFVVQPSDTTAKKIPVTIAYLENDYVAVADPVLLNDEVITEGASFLEDGSKISIIK